MHELDGEALIFDPVSADTHRLNETALFVWQQCDGRHDAEQIARRLIQAYDVSIDRALESVERVFDEFESCHLMITTDDDKALGDMA